MSHKGSWNRTHDHQASRAAWDRIWGRKEPKQEEPEIQWIYWTLDQLPEIGEMVWPEWYCVEIDASRIKVQRIPFIEPPRANTDATLAAPNTSKGIWGSRIRIDTCNKPGETMARAILAKDQMDAMNDPNSEEGQRIRDKIQAEFNRVKSIDSNAKTSVVIGDHSRTRFLAQ